ncbi:MAG: alternative ribosome rescue aminoacyl-tRNA hydrolase ArfB [Frankiaceae bacterium]
MPEPLRIRPGVEIPRQELTWRFSRSSGPGGQAVNTSDSRAELSFDLGHSPWLPDALRARALGRLRTRLHDGVLTVVADEQRSQLQNRAAAEARLVALLKAATDPPPPSRRRTRPTRASVERRLAAKRRRADVKRLRRSRPAD